LLVGIAAWNHHYLVLEMVSMASDVLQQSTGRLLLTSRHDPIAQNVGFSPTPLQQWSQVLWLSHGGQNQPLELSLPNKKATWLDQTRQDLRQ
jgi:hypothetical protein